MDQKEILAVLDEDIVPLLQSIGEFERIEKGHEYCIVCGKPITIRNLQFIIPKGNNEFRYVCNDLACAESFGRKEGM